MKPEEIRKKIDLAPESLTLVMQLEYKGKKTFLQRTFSNPLWPPPRNVAASIDRLTRRKDVRVAFVTGHYERRSIQLYRDREYKFRTEL